MSSTINNKKFIIIGLIASLSLLFVYFAILSIASSFSHALEQFVDMWYWMLFLIVGFGFQVGLYFYIRASFRLKQMASPTATVAASGGVSAGSMIACCLHHLTDVLPLLGLAVAATFLSTYQLFFIIIGILSNLVGITMMLEIIQKHNLSDKFFKNILIYNMNKIKKITIISALVLSAVAFLFAGGFLKKSDSQSLESEPIQNQEVRPEAPKTVNLPSKINSQNEISFEVSPIDFNLDNPVRFEIAIDTHSGSLDFDLTKISILRDNEGNEYQATDWQGSASGGHHRSGVLAFPKVDLSVKVIELTIKDDSNSLPRVFEWDLEQ